MMTDEHPTSSERDPRDYQDKWIGWVTDPLIEKAGITFDRTPSGPIHAPAGMIRVCAYHIDFDERPTCYLDVADIEEARFICHHIDAARGGWNVDFAVAYDAGGIIVVPLDWY